jgi:glutamate 5-kinase
MAGVAGADIAELTPRRREVLVVSSGAIALGRTILGLKAKALKLEESQAAAAVGQIALAALVRRAWPHMLTSGQILLTLGDTEERRRYLNARATIDAAQDARRARHQRERHGGDLRNPLRRQRPAGRARRHHDGRRSAGAAVRHRRALHRAAAPRPEREFIPVVEAHHAGDRGDGGAAASELSRGGMRTKIDAGKIATAAGTAMIITSGTRLNRRCLRSSAASARPSSSRAETR